MNCERCEWAGGTCVERSLRVYQYAQATKAREVLKMARLVRRAESINHVIRYAL